MSRRRLALDRRPRPNGTPVEGRPRKPAWRSVQGVARNTYRVVSTCDAREAGGSPAAWCVRAVDTQVVPVSSDHSSNPLITHCKHIHTRIHRVTLPLLTTPAGRGTLALLVMLDHLLVSPWPSLSAQSPTSLVSCKRLDLNIEVTESYTRWTSTHNKARDCT